MPRAKAKPDPAPGDTTPDEPESMRSEEVMVIPPAQDEPVRMGGHILTENGWVVEDGPAPDPEPTDEGDTPVPAPDPEQE